MRRAISDVLYKTGERLRRMQNAHALNKLFIASARQQIKKAINEAERDTSGEIRMRVISRFDRGVSDVLTQARIEFVRLKMHETKDRTGVLLLLVFRERQFQILADDGILAKVPQEFWNDLASRLAFSFRHHLFVMPICNTVKQIGVALANHFPHQIDDVDELSNDLSIEGEE